MIIDAIEQLIKEKNLQDALEVIEERGKYEVRRKTSHIIRTIPGEHTSMSMGDYCAMIGVSDKLSETCMQEKEALKGALTPLLDYSRFIHTAISEKQWFDIVLIEMIVERLLYVTEENHDFLGFNQKNTLIEPPNMESLLFLNIKDCLYKPQVFERILSEETPWPPQPEQLLSLLNESQTNYNFSKISFIKSFFCYSYLLHHSCFISNYNSTPILSSHNSYLHYELLLNKFKGKIDIESFIQHTSHAPERQFLESYHSKQLISEKIQYTHDTKVLKI